MSEPTAAQAGLTIAELEVLELVAREGLTNDAIASRVHCAENTVRARLARVFRKLGIPSRAYAAAWWERHHGVGVELEAVRRVLRGG